MKTGGDGKEGKEEQHKGMGKVREDMDRGKWWRWEEKREKLVNGKGEERG